MIRTRRGYTCLLFALLPGVLWHLLRKAWRQPAYLRHLAERFGFFSVAPGRPVLWLHAVSVGKKGHQGVGVDPRGGDLTTQAIDGQNQQGKEDAPFQLRNLGDAGEG